MIARAFTTPSRRGAGFDWMPLERGAPSSLTGKAKETEK